MSTIVRSALFLAMAGASLTGQTITASLEGNIKDATGAVIPGARVAVVNAATGITARLETGADGRFVAPSLQPGPYSVIVEAAGFKKVDRSGIVLQVDQAARIEIVLEVGAVSETVEIKAEAPLLESSSAALGQVIENRAITNLPLNARNPYALVFLAPGVTGNVAAQFNQANISINGGRPGANEILADGIPSSPPLVNPIQGFTVYPSVDSVQEFKVQTNSYSAEFGRSSGGIINLVFKSGTNQFHGTLFEFVRNSKLDANGFFANQRGLPLTNFKRNQFGASGGGPVLIPGLYNGRNRTFFFAAYEGLKERSQSNLTATGPTDLQRNGDFSRTLTAAGALISVYDPTTTVAQGTGFVRTAFPGNVIPASRQDPVARNVIKYYPAANRAGDTNTQANNLSLPGTAPTDSNQFDIKGDENINDRNRFFVRVSHRNYNLGLENRFPTEIAVAQGGSYQPQVSNNAAFDYTFNLRPTFLIDFRYGFGRTLLNFSPRSAGFDPTTLGFPSYLAANAEGIYFPTFSPTGYLALGGTSFARRNAFETHNWSLNNSKVMTRHLLKFGFEVRLVRVNNSEITDAVGNFTFDKTFTQGPNPNAASNTAGDGMASLLLGLGNGVLTRCFKCVSTQSMYYGWYFSDDWKVTNKLTLNLGLRYELEIPRHERYNRVNVFDPFVTSPLASRAGLPNLKGGLVFAGVNGESAQQFPADTNNWAPRFGFAYQARRDTVIRGGAGIFYSPSYRAAGGTVGNFGYRSDTQFIGSANGLTPTNYLRNPFPDGFVPVVGSALGLSTAVGSTISASLKNDSTVAYSENWSFNVQHQLKGDLLVEAGYVGSHGLHLTQTGEGTANLNLLTREQLALGTQLQQQVSNPFFGVITSGVLSTRTVPQSFLLRAYPQYTTVNPLYWTGSSSIYHSFQLKVEKRFGSGLSLLTAYTNAKLIDEFSIISNVGRNANIQNIHDRRNERAVSSNDISQRFVTSAVYALPFGRGRSFGGGWNRMVDAVLGGWQMNGILTFQRGFPLALTTTNSSNAGGNVLRPNNNGKSAQTSGDVKSRLTQYFDKTVFSQPAPFTFGNVGRTLPDVRAPGLRNLDYSLFKNFGVTERVAVQFRAESFNLTNTATFGEPNQNFTAVQFGQITGTSNIARQVQFGLKILF
ncbi:MAG: carboxypeptidase regulatory-like domain-containing protein [Acidobacteria bacterium]|nr:carboxypeptidase regulatory-like domain-containing protein [Acidobacteriota bacterium]